MTFRNAHDILYNMSDYCNTTQYLLRYSDFDFKDELQPSTLLSIVQEAACSSADELGFGYDDLRPRAIGFIVVNTYCVFKRPIRLGDKLTVQTWPLPPRHVFFERDYRVLAGEEEVADVASRWCLVDLKTFTLLMPDVLGEVHARCPYRAEKTTEVPAWKIPRIREGRVVYEAEVRNSHCDHYLHANNARYADFFFDCFSMEELAARPVAAFQITYVKQAKEGSRLTFVREDVADGALCEARTGDEIIAQFRVRFGEDGQ